MKKILLAMVALAIMLAPVMNAGAYGYKNKLRSTAPAAVTPAPDTKSCPMMQEKGKDMGKCPCMKDGKCPCMKDGKCPCMNGGKCDCKMCKEGKCPMCGKKAEGKKDGSGKMCPMKKEKK